MIEFTEKNLHSDLRSKLGFNLATSPSLLHGIALKFIISLNHEKTFREAACAVVF